MGAAAADGGAVVVDETSCLVVELSAHRSRRLSEVIVEMRDLREGVPVSRIPGRGGQVQPIDDAITVDADRLEDGVDRYFVQFSGSEHCRLGTHMVIGTAVQAEGFAAKLAAAAGADDTATAR